MEVAVTDGDSWWDSGKQLKDILVSNSTLRGTKRGGIYIQPSAGDFVEPYGVVIDGCFFEENNSDGQSAEGAAIHVNAESLVISNNVIDEPAGASDYGIFVTATAGGDDQPNPSAVVIGNDVSWGTYGIEPVRISLATVSVGSKTIQADNIYPGPGRVLRQQYKVTTTNNTTTTIWSYIVPASMSGIVDVVITGSNADGTKAVSYEFYSGFRRNTTTTSLSTGTAAFTSVRSWNPDTIATIPTATLSVNTLQAEVTGVTGETWTWSCLVDMSTSK
jgi:hypothetical protein